MTFLFLFEEGAENESKEKSFKEEIIESVEQTKCSTEV